MISMMSAFYFFSLLGVEGKNFFFYPLNKKLAAYEEWV